MVTFHHQVYEDEKPWRLYHHIGDQEIVLRITFLNILRNKKVITLHILPSGKRLHNYGKSPCYQWVNPLFLWAMASIANCNKLPERNFLYQP